MNACEELGLLDGSRAIDSAVAKVAESARRLAMQSSSVWISTVESACPWQRR